MASAGFWRCRLRVKRFVGISENAVKTQIWCAIATYVLIAIIKKELRLNASLYIPLRTLSVSVFEKNEHSYGSRRDAYQFDCDSAANQLILF